MSDSVESKERAIEAGCRCPFCQEEMPKLFPFCTNCGVKLSVCASCCKPVPQDVDICPNCGAKIDR